MVIRFQTLAVLACLASFAAACGTTPEGQGDVAVAQAQPLEAPDACEESEFDTSLAALGDTADIIKKELECKGDCVLDPYCTCVVDDGNGNQIKRLMVSQVSLELTCSVPCIKRDREGNIIVPTSCKDDGKAQCEAVTNDEFRDSVIAACKSTLKGNAFVKEVTCPTKAPQYIYPLSCTAK